MRSFRYPFSALAAFISTASAQNNFINPGPKNSKAAVQTFTMNIDQPLSWTSTYTNISMLLWSNYQDPKTSLYQTYTIIDNIPNPNAWNFQVGENIDISNSHSYHFEIYNGTADNFANESFFVSTDFNVVSPSGSSQSTTATSTSASTSGKATTSATTTTVSQSTVTQIIPVTPSNGPVSSTTLVITTSLGTGSQVSTPTGSGEPGPTAGAATSGLSHDAQVGIGVGVGVGIPLIVGALAAIWYFTRKRGGAGKKAENSAYGINYSDEAAR